MLTTDASMCHRAASASGQMLNQSQIQWPSSCVKMHVVSLVLSVSYTGHLPDFPSYPLSFSLSLLCNLEHKCDDELHLSLKHSCICTAWGSRSLTRTSDFLVIFTPAKPVLVQVGLRLPMSKYVFSCFFFSLSLSFCIQEQICFLLQPVWSL